MSDAELERHLARVREQLRDMRSHVRGNAEQMVTLCSEVARLECGDTVVRQDHALKEARQAFLCAKQEEVVSMLQSQSSRFGLLQRTAVIAEARADTIGSTLDAAATQARKSLFQDCRANNDKIADLCDAQALKTLSPSCLVETCNETCNSKSREPWFDVLGRASGLVAAASASRARRVAHEARHQHGIEEMSIRAERLRSRLPAISRRATPCMVRPALCRAVRELQAATDRSVESINENSIRLRESRSGSLSSSLEANPAGTSKTTDICRFNHFWRAGS